MNSHYRPMDPSVRPAGSASAAIVTAGYAPDFERCRLLCETIDRRVTGAGTHYLLVAGHDVARFKVLEGSNREVVDERDILPSWLHAVRDPLSGFRRRAWLSLRAMPLRGWHVQQLRRIAIAGSVSDDLLVFCDSDVAFVRPFDCGRFTQAGKTALFRRDDVLDTPGHDEQRVWSRNAGRALGLAETDVSRHDYIGTLIAWRRETVNAMTRHIEAEHGRGWVEVVAARRHFSECMLYGRYVDDVTGGAGHFHQPDPFCHIYWNGPRLDHDGFARFVDAMAPQQVAVGVQSFTGTGVADLRRWIAEN